MKVKDIFERFRENSLSTTEAGTKFEEFVKSFLLTDPEFASQIEEVWMWKDFPYKQGHDIGIDLVARTVEGEYLAIQCKFYAENNNISKKDIDTFLAASGKTFTDDKGKQRYYSARYIFSTTDSWAKNAEKEIEGQVIPVQRFGLTNFEESAIDWDAFNVDNYQSLRLRSKKKLRPHQAEALDAVIDTFKTDDRTKLILACGTGKTFTSLEIARRQTNDNGNILFLAPSISLVAQSMKEWMIECGCQIYPFVVCSDSSASKDEDLKTCDLIHPATTNPKNLETQYRFVENKEGLKVVFSTYQSIDVVKSVQEELGIEFDLVICDEAHRTTGVNKATEEGSYFTKVHSNDNIQAKKRLYMTATPRVYTPNAKAKAEENQYTISSMDDEEVYGKEAYRLGFADAIRRGLLCDYKVQIIAIDESLADSRFRQLFDDNDLEVKVDDAAKIYGTWMGLSKYSTNPDEYKSDPGSMKRAILYTNTIAESKKVAKLITQIMESFNDENDGFADVEIEHVDGTMSASDRSQRLSWLREETDGETCRVLTNARCLSEGIDVPALDGVAFLNPRASIIDIIQAVGRVMRKPASGDKKYGYILLPVVIRASEDPNKVLDNNSFKVVWSVLQALRAHDERLEAEINKIGLTGKSTGRAGGGGTIGVSVFPKGGEDGNEVQIQFNLPEIDSIRGLIISKLVETCGNKKYWETWAKDVAEISERHKTRIQNLLAEKNPEVTSAFTDFHESLKSNINTTISEDDAIEMLAQHMITEPVFSSLFEGYSFSKSNPVSKEMDKVILALETHGFEEERESLDRFYADVRERCEGIDTLEGRQKVISDLYGSFFKTAFPKQSEKLGIVYTPVEVVDFIISSVNVLLKQEFGKTLSDAGVTILDPFTGTGTFISRLISGDFISKDALPLKYMYEMSANEIVLLAYYIATVNIEETYHSIMGLDHYEPFNGIVLTDTFQMYEDGDIKKNLGLPENSKRIEQQKNKDITVILGNPPFSIGQRSQNDNNQNVKYPHLDSRIEETYSKDSKASSKKSLYDSYIKAFRWATDRLGEDGGIIGFVTNGAYVDNAGMDGFRKHLIQDFTDVYVFNLRGNQRTSGELSRKEGGKIFGSGSRAPIAITLLVKNPGKQKSGQVHYYDIGDYLSRQEKLDLLKKKENVNNLDWQIIRPDENNDWINLRNEEFESYPVLGDKKNKQALTIFDRYSLGVVSGRDSWVTNYSREKVNSNTQIFIKNYRDNVEGYKRSNRIMSFKDFVNKDPEKISWTRALYTMGKNGKSIDYNKKSIFVSSYRPFNKKYTYFDRSLNEIVSLQPSLFPSQAKKNLVIQVSGVGVTQKFSCLITDLLIDYNRIQAGQSFPLYWYEENTGQASMFHQEEYIRHDGISDEYLKRCRHIYNDQSIAKEDIFYYIYGILHSPEYRSKFEADLKKSLPRIPFSKNFWLFSKAGRELANLHLNYETVEPYPLEEIGSGPYTVQKMKYASKDDHSTLIYNDFIKLSGIPKEVDEYIVNGRTALGWIMEQYQVKTDKDSGIVNDPNDWCKEMNDERYIIDLVKRICTVSVETVRIVNGLPSLDVIQKKVKEPIRKE